VVSLYSSDSFSMSRFENEKFATCMLIMLPVQLIRDEIQAGKSDKEIFKKLEEDFGETVLYAPKFDLQTAGLWLSPVSLRA
jgi:cytochrome c-type biogenesis protein CcmH/NrfF